MTMDLDPAVYFSFYGTCACGKPATGAVMNQRNEVLARTCTRCGRKRIERAETARALATQLEARHGKF
jgi:predicted RNA-binding Zn-ribbon protein involved in translation (DUF1610 family)